MIRRLDPGLDLPLVEEFYSRAADYWILADRRAPDRQKAAEFFTDCPPYCDPDASHRLGLFLGDLLIGVAELSFGWPQPEDAYLGLQLIAPDQRGQGFGRTLLAEVEARARAAGAPMIYLGVLDENPKGRDFWERQGFSATGISRRSEDTGHLMHRLSKRLSG